jgi:hypothetical protein
MLSLVIIEEAFLKHQEHFIYINLFLILETDQAIYKID